MASPEKRPETNKVHPKMTKTTARNIVMIRPDILNRKSDAHFVRIAKAFHSYGHRVTIITCTTNAALHQNDLKDLEIIETSTWVPRAIYGRFRCLMFMFRTLCAAAKYITVRANLQPSIIFSNGSCVALPILALDRYSTTIHMQNPMELGQVCRKDHLKFLNWMLDKTILMPHEVVETDPIQCKHFNDLFGLYGRFCSTMYPCVDDALSKAINMFDTKDIVPSFHRNGFLFCCFGEYYSYSNFELALAGFCLAMSMVESRNAKKMHLVIGGDFDPTNRQQMEYFTKIQEMIYYKMYSKKITMLRRLSQTQKKCLMFEAKAIIHPVLNEVFNTTILEAMCLAKTVIATDTSFGKEVLINQITGYLVPPNPIDFAEILEKLINNKILPICIENLGETEFRYKHSFLQFSNCLNRLVAKRRNIVKV